MNDKFIFKIGFFLHVTPMVYRNLGEKEWWWILASHQSVLFGSSLNPHWLWTSHAATGPWKWLRALFINRKSDITAQQEMQKVEWGAQAHSTNKTHPVLSRVFGNCNAVEHHEDEWYRRGSLRLFFAQFWNLGPLLNPTNPSSAVIAVVSVTAYSQRPSAVFSPPALWVQEFKAVTVTFTQPGSLFTWIPLKKGKHDFRNTGITIICIFLQSWSIISPEKKRIFQALHTFLMSLSDNNSKQ